MTVALLVAAISYLVYHQVSAAMVAKTQETLQEQLRFVDRTVTSVFTESARMAGMLLARSSRAELAGPPYLQDLARLKASIPVCRRIWTALPDGSVVPGPLADAAYLESHGWWKSHLSPDLSRSSVLSDTGDTLGMTGKPFRDTLNLSTMVPVIIYRFAGVAPVATVFIEIDLTELLGAYVRDSSGTLGSSAVNASIYDKDGDLLESTANLFVVARQPLVAEHRLALDSGDLNTLQASGRLRVEDRDSVGLYRRDPATGLIFSSHVPRSSIVRSTERMTMGILGIGGASLAVIVALGLLLVRSVYRMKTFEELQIRARLETLQAKMNPHFLFNTLDSMVGAAERNDQSTLLGMLRALSYMLHMSVRRDEDLIRLDEELRYVGSYVELQRVRYRDSFDFVEEVEEEARDLYVYRFCIQPMVENCFVHGVALDPTRRIRIVLTARRDRGALVLTVVDDGPGCAPQARAELARLLHDESRGASRRIGLSAVNTRIRALHGKRFGLSLLPAEQGFAVQAVLPALRSP